MSDARSFIEADRQLPLGQELFLDHVGHFVRDVGAAQDALKRAGFVPTPPSIQVNPGPGGKSAPTGTGNVTAMLRRGYIEVLFKTAATDLGRELDAAIARYPGVHLAALAAADVAREHKRLQQGGFRVRPLVDMRRAVETEAGAAEAAFTVARLQAGEMPEGRIQILTHRTEDAVWQPRWLSHPHGVTGLLGLVIAVGDVEAAAERFARFADRQMQPNDAGRVLQLDRGTIQLTDAPRFHELAPMVAVPSLPFIGAYALTVASLAALEQRLHQADIAARRDGPVLTAAFPEALGTGAWIFVEQKADLPWL